MYRSYLSQLNIGTDSTLDFSTAEWQCRRQGKDFIVSVHLPDSGIVGEATIEGRIWPALTARGRELTFRATILVAASNLVDNWRNSHAA